MGESLQGPAGHSETRASSRPPSCPSASSTGISISAHLHARHISCRSRKAVDRASIDYTPWVRQSRASRSLKGCQDAVFHVEDTRNSSDFAFSSLTYVRLSQWDGCPLAMRRVFCAVPSAHYLRSLRVRSAPSGMDKIAICTPSSFSPPPLLPAKWPRQINRPDNNRTEGIASIHTGVSLSWLTSSRRISDTGAEGATSA